MIQITGGGCGVPAEATAVSGNLTVTNVSEQGFLRLFPTGTNPFVNGVSYRPGVTRANNFNLGLSGLGRLTLTASTASTADGIVDVSGYYAYPAPTWTLTFRDEANRLSTEYAVTSSTITRTKNYFHFGNLLVSTRDAGGGFLYYASDHLGTPRLVTNQGGAAVENHTYHPFGQEITPLFGNQPLKFAAMERDQSSGNDSAHARVCSPTQGRFLSPDLVQGHPEDPQSWNRYAYALNNPLKHIDTDGHAPRDAMRLIWTRFKHIVDRHVRKDIPEFAHKSKFLTNDPAQAKKLLERTIRHPDSVRSLEDGSKEYLKQHAKVVGPEGETSVRAITRPIGPSTEKVITGHPILELLTGLIPGMGAIELVKEGTRAGVAGADKLEQMGKEGGPGALKRREDEERQKALQEQNYLREDN